MDVASGERRRLDVALVERGLFETRQRAQAAVLAGRVRVDGRVERRPGRLLPPGATLEVERPAVEYVSRGGQKLAHALDAFGVDPAGRVAIDVGASTGGFTDCLLRRGASRVYAVDVGRGQLAWRLRQDPRVVVMERTNARHLDPSAFDPKPELVVCDVSFISLLAVLGPAAAVSLPGSPVVALIKPQFEAGRRQVGRGGVVRDPAIWRQVLERVVAAAPGCGVEPVDLCLSPLPGADGNREFFLHGYVRSVAEEGAGPKADWQERIDGVVALAAAEGGGERPSA